MFLTPFIDFGEPIERFLGLPQMEKSESREDEPVADMSAISGPQKVGIFGVSHKLKIVSATDRGTTLEGCGIAIGSGPLDQSKAYFEVRIEVDGTKLAVGAVGRNPMSVLSENWQILSKVPNSISSGSLGSFKAGEVLGVVIDIADFPPSVSVYHENDQLVKTVSLSVRGDLWPAVEIREGTATVVLARPALSHLTQQRLSRGIEAVMVSRSII
jgi:hypothetical protein